MGTVESVEEKVRRYIRLTEEALERVEIAAPEGHMRRVAEDFLDVARRYLSDARWFAEKGDFATALAAVSYAHAWIDAGVRMGVLKGEGSRLFMHG